MEGPSLPPQFNMYTGAAGQMIPALKSSQDSQHAASSGGQVQPTAPRSMGSVPRPIKLVAPYFDYKDHSHVSDPDPSVPLTAPGRLPNFPVKMLAILSREDLSHIISWMPHGRSWRVWKPREFEIKVIPTYFEHSKFSSFIRQANGWGFRRITKGPDRNSYYHELFLRGLPHLTKQMQRPHPSQKPALNPHTEPKFYQISQEHPLPECSKDKGFSGEADHILAQCTLVQRGNMYNGDLITAGAEEQKKSADAQVSLQRSAHMQHQRDVAPAAIQQNLDDWEPTPVGATFSSSSFQPTSVSHHEAQPCMEPIPFVQQPQQQQMYHHHHQGSLTHQHQSNEDSVVPLANLPSCTSFPDLEEFLAKCAANLQGKQSQCMEPLPVTMPEPKQQQAAPQPRMAPSGNANATWTHFAADEPVLTKNHVTERDLERPSYEVADAIPSTDSFINALDLGHGVQSLFDF